MSAKLAGWVAVIGLYAIAVVAPSAGAAVPPPGYREAKAAFETRLMTQRARLQIMMIGTGYWLAMPNALFGERFFDAIRRFQSENGYPVTGILDDVQIGRLSALSDAAFDVWGFRKITHPFRARKIWIPFGLGLTAERKQFGLHYVDPQRRVLIDFMSIPNIDIGDNFSTMVNAVQQDGETLNYKVFKDGWFVISFSSPGGVDHYIRYHQDDANVTGFSLSWNNANGDVHGERIATLMSASLWADTVGPWAIDPPAPRPRPSPPPPAQTAVARPAPAPDAPPAHVPEPEKKPDFKSGTGFFVEKDGALLTNAHVVDACTDLRVKTQDGTASAATIAAIDSANDLAVLRTDRKPATVAAFRIGARLGETVEAFGFPHSDLLSSSGNFTVGNITALNGMGDDSRYMQVSAPVQAGNSGGPLLDQSGNVVGIVTAKLNALKVALEGGDLPQNVNFAVKTSIIAAFLDSNRIELQTGAVAAKPMDPPDIADRARAISGFVLCQAKP